MKRILTLVVLALALVFPANAAAATQIHFGVAYSNICNATQSASWVVRAVGSGNYRVDSYITLPGGSKTAKNIYYAYLNDGQDIQQWNDRRFVPYGSPGWSTQYIEVFKNNALQNKWGISFFRNCA